MYDDEFEFFGFFMLWLIFVIVIGLLVGLIVNASDEPSRAVMQCVETRMQTLEGLDMWSGESERAEMAAALENFCEAVQ